MASDSTVKGILAGAGAALLVLYLYKKNNKKINSLAKNAVGYVPGNLYPLKCMSDAKLEELKENIEDVLSERETKKENEK